MTLRGDPSQLRYGGQRFSSHSQDLRHLANTYRNRALGLLQGSNGWTGAGADPFRDTTERICKEMEQACTSLESVAGILQTLAGRLESINQMQSEANHYEQQAYYADDSTPEGQHRYSSLMRQARDLHHRAEQEAELADRQAAAALDCITVPRIGDLSSLQSQGPSGNGTVSWETYYNRHKNTEDPDPTAYTPVSIGSYKRIDEEESERYLAEQAAEPSFWQQLDAFMTGGVEGVKEKAYGMLYSVSHISETWRNFTYAITHPETVIESLVDSAKEIRDDWESGNAYGLGKATSEIAWTIIGAKVTSEAGKAAKEGLGDISLPTSLQSWFKNSGSVVLSDGTVVRVPLSTLKTDEELGRYLKDHPDGQKEDSLSQAEVQYGEHYTKVDRKKALQPDVTYSTPAGYTYTTDSLGRVINVEAELVLEPGERNAYAQRVTGRTDRQPSDDGGHLIGTQFKGSGDLDNLVPMDSQINRAGGKWYRMEQEWVKALSGDPPQSVKVNIKPLFSGNSIRPDKFKIIYKIGNGREIKITIKNQPGG